MTPYFSFFPLYLAEHALLLRVRPFKHFCLPDFELDVDGRALVGGRSQKKKIASRSLRMFFEPEKATVKTKMISKRSKFTGNGMVVRAVISK